MSIFLIGFLFTYVDLYLGKRKGKLPRSNSVNKIYLTDYIYIRLIYNGSSFTCTYYIIVLFQNIGNTRPEGNETELIPLRKGQTIENDLFGEEEDKKSIQIRMK
jgi:hypothetical protein